jgi:hypothetical protein
MGRHVVVYSSIRYKSSKWVAVLSDRDTDKEQGLVRMPDWLVNIADAVCEIALIVVHLQTEPVEARQIFIYRIYPAGFAARLRSNRIAIQLMVIAC